MMGILKAFIIILIAFTVIYMIIKYVGQLQDNKLTIQADTKNKIDVEIVSNDLYMKAENLISLHEVYGLQVSQIVNMINDVEAEIEKEMNSPIKSDKDIRLLTLESLKLQKKKCDIEASMIQICDKLDKIAIEELKRQQTR